VLFVVVCNSRSPPATRPGAVSKSAGELAIALPIERKGEAILGQNNQFKRALPHQPTRAEFARLSSSMQLTLLVIRRAQVSSRRAVAVAASRASSRQINPGD
jgi:hypothetical protein